MHFSSPFLETQQIYLQSSILFFFLSCLGETQIFYLHSSQITALPTTTWCLRTFCVTPRLAGSYEALDGGSAADAIVDFTGAVAESVDLVQGKYGEIISEQMKLFEDLLKVHKRGGLISCYIAVCMESCISGVHFSEKHVEKSTIMSVLSPSFICILWNSIVCRKLASWQCRQPSTTPWAAECSHKNTKPLVLLPHCGSDMDSFWMVTVPYWPKVNPPALIYRPGGSFQFLWEIVYRKQFCWPELLRFLDLGFCDAVIWSA